MMSIVMDGSQASGSASMIVMAAANGPLIVSDHIFCSQMGCNHRLFCSYIHLQFDLQWALFCSPGSGGFTRYGSADNGHVISS